MFVKNSHKLFSFILLSFSAISFCLEESSILLLPFQTKSLQKVDDEEEDVEPYQTESDEDWPYVPKTPVFNSSQFINKWFYNGLNIKIAINKYHMESYIYMDNSKLSIEKCNSQRIASAGRSDNNYNPLNSDTYTKKEENLGNDVFTFIGDLHYKTTINIGEKGDGLDFYFKEKDKNEDLCGIFGFNIDTTLDKTNLITQLKKKNYINKYIWTLNYLQEEDGIIILGTEPHFYDNDRNLMSQYCEIKALPSQSPDTAWSFKIDEIRIKPKDSDNVILSDNKIDLLADRGLIIGTNEYKTKIDELVFNDLISKRICFREEVNNKDEKGVNDIYYVYYCDKTQFMRNKYTEQYSYYYLFPSLQFYLKEANMTFTLVNDHLFHEIYNRAYFLIVFKKSGDNNNIWKLGEPFLSHFQFTFEQDKKIVGFYNPIMPRISNEDYLREKEKEKQQTKEKNENLNNSDDKKTIIIIIIISVISVIILSVAGYFVGKKVNEIRKKRANELKDEFEYVTADNNNANQSDENSQENDVLGIRKD